MNEQPNKKRDDNTSPEKRRRKSRVEIGRGEFGWEEVLVPRVAKELKEEEKKRIETVGWRKRLREVEGEELEGSDSLVVTASKMELEKNAAHFIMDSVLSNVALDIQAEKVLDDVPKGRKCACIIL